MSLRGMLVAGLGVCLSLAAWSDPNWKTLTDAPRNVDGQNALNQRARATTYGKLVVAMPMDHWMLNTNGSMGADNEYYNDNVGARLGVWAGSSLEGKEPRAVVSDWVGNIKKLTGGEWTAPRSTSLAGTPVVESSGSDAYGNYFYKVISFTKMGEPVALAIRTPYENRWNRDLDEDIVYIVSNTHLTSEAMRNSLKRKWRRNR